MPTNCRWLCLLAVCAVVPALIRGEEPKLTPLFNGKDLSGWKQVGGKKDVWAAEDGLLVCTTGGGDWLSTTKTYGDFILRLEYRLQPGGNSGVFIRAPHQGQPWIQGMEIQLLDDDHAKYKSLKPYQYTGSVYGVVPAKRGATRPAGEWNKMAITARGSRVTVVLNETTITDADLAKHKDAAKDHPGITRKDGHLGLQSHDDRVEFRNVVVAELK